MNKNNKYSKNEYKTLIILDWDDTLFPTSWTVQNGIDVTNKYDTEKYKSMFLKLDNVLYDLLLSLQQYGTVVIVTNAVVKWVKMSSIILPKTKQLIDKSIDIVSAREIMQEKVPTDMNIWKKVIFEELVIDHYIEHDGYEHIISIGDAEYEFIALTDLYNEHSVTHKRLLKSVKLISNPSFETLVDQIIVLKNSAKKIIDNKKHMDLKFKKL